MRQCSLTLEEDLALHLHACQDRRICLWLDAKPGVEGGVLDREQALSLSLALVDWVEWLDAPEPEGEGPWGPHAEGDTP